MTFDDSVRLIRNRGVEPRCTGKKKSQCTPEEWAAHREYMVARYKDPRCREMHRLNQIKYLAKAR